MPYVESGELTLIGATTENPSFEVISPLLSRCRVFVLEPLSEAAPESDCEEDKDKSPQDAFDWLFGYATATPARRLG